MSSDQEKNNIEQSALITLSEMERLKRDIYRPDMEKFRLFTQMLKRNIMLKKAVIRHK